MQHGLEHQGLVADTGALCVTLPRIMNTMFTLFHLLQGYTNKREREGSGWRRGGGGSEQVSGRRIVLPKPHNIQKGHNTVYLY